MKKVETNSSVKVNYTGRLEDGTIFDSSIVEGREPLDVQLGQGQLISGFEKGLIGMAEGEKKTIEIESPEAYGDPNEEFINEIPKANVPEGVQVGETLQGMGPMGPVNVKVVAVNEETVTLDANHPLAGKKLIFDLEVVSIA
ncbi:MAG: peptidylprolyl isomerase [Flavobacteriaceae bacterium]|jgi:FKBP-type peptidyl-prolyl cis-trans isomerase SlpA|nr:peptidylprolyl isomerase [Flavobacteriaceae bacterium]